MSGKPIDLILDTGNTRTKAALFSGARLLRRGSFDTTDELQFDGFLQGVVPDRIAWGSVAATHERLEERIARLAPVFAISGSTAAPIHVKYATPATLGVDRLANAVAAAAMFPQRAVLAVDLGTCITYDPVDRYGTYRGGAISPGVRMRALAMNAYSARLPLVDPGDDPSALGSSTEGALAAGIHQGILGEIKEFMRAYAHDGEPLAVVLTGGDTGRFARAMKSGIFAHPFLTLEGLRLILHHHHGGSGLLGSASSRKARGPRPAG